MLTGRSRAVRPPSEEAASLDSEKPSLKDPGEKSRP